MIRSQINVVCVEFYVVCVVGCFVFVAVLHMFRFGSFVYF